MNKDHIFERLNILLINLERAKEELFELGSEALKNQLCQDIDFEKNSKDESNDYKQTEKNIFKAWRALNKAVSYIEKELKG